ncbi:MAG: hypothetical protein RLZZ516_1712 [Cyanobacteriota bacterium]|jgi:hypothetical protein
MARIRQRRDRHFIDDQGRLYWINGPDHHCYLSEQRQWRQGLSFEEILLWKQCAPSGLVSQRFPSAQAACEAFEHNQVQWNLDLYLRHMGDEMALQRGADDYKPTAIKDLEGRDGRLRQPPWQGTSTPPPRCDLSTRPAPTPSVAASLAASRAELPHQRRRRRSGAPSV